MLSSAFPKFYTAGLDLKESSLEPEGSDPARKAIRLKEHISGRCNFLYSFSGNYHVRTELILIYSLAGFDIANSELRETSHSGRCWCGLWLGS